MTINEAKQLLAKAQKIAVLTGAGMSTESGLPDFRANEGLYNPLTADMTFHVKMFRTYPERFYSAIKPFYEQCVNASPNAGHLAIAELERQGKSVFISTQNVDRLHQKAGSSIVNELYGTIDMVNCRTCKRHFKTSDFAESFATDKVPYCPICGKILKPDLVLFGERLPSEPLEKTRLAFMGADIVMVLGASLRTSPVNTLPGYRFKETPLFIINHAPTQYDEYAEFVSHEKIGDILPQLVGVA